MQKERNGQRRTARVRVEGPLDFDHARPMYERLIAAVHDPRCSDVKVDLERLQGLDSAGAALLSYTRRMAEASGKSFELEHLHWRYASHFELVPRADAARPTPPGPAWTDRALAAGGRGSEFMLELVAMTVDSARHVVTTGFGLSPSRIGSLMDQSVRIGVNAVPIVGLLSALVGVVLAFQGVYQLERFGADMFVAEVVSLGMVREFGPLITAIIVAGRSGAAMAAELGTMSVREELDALRALGIEPTSLLVAPRLIAITLAGPTLTFLSMAVGIAAGIGVASLLDLPAPAVFARMRDALVLDDFVLGFVKSLLFAWLIGIVGCFFGLATRGGPTSVGQNTTRAVVFGIFLIVVVDSAVTTLWTLGQDG